MGPHFLFLIFTGILIETTLAQIEVEKCRVGLRNSSMTTFDGLIGMGYDNLRNVPMAAVLKTTYNECRTSPDVDFLVPDYMQVLPIKKIHLDRTANFYDHWQDYFKTTTQTINVDAGGKFSHFGISGSYSEKHENTKKKFVEQKSSLLHTSLKYHAYSILAEPTALHPAFLARLEEVYDALSKNLTRKAKYLAELTIRDFGTHLVTQADVGATIEQEDYVSSNIQFSSTSSLDEMKASASASFFSTFHMSVSSGRNVSEQSKENFTSVLKHTEVITQGGPGVNKLLDAAAKDAQEVKLFVDNLIAIDRSGVPLFTIITPAILPNIRPYYIGLIGEYIKNATEEYYKRNKIEGCMEMLSPNFNFQANVNDSSCEAVSYHFIFGGFYQTCQILSEQGAFISDGIARCDAYKQVNTATGDFRCDTGFEPVELITIEHHLPDRVVHHQYEDCDCGFLCLWDDCHTVSYDVIFKDRAKISTHWCREVPPPAVKIEVPLTEEPQPEAPQPEAPVSEAPPPEALASEALPPEAPASEALPLETPQSRRKKREAENHGFMFGGLFDINQVNPFTGGPNCPGHYQPYKMSLNVTVCLSRDYQLDAPYSIGFSGFFSCQTPSAQKECVKGYSQHLATVAEGCDIYYCVKPEAFVFRNPALIKRPPFEDISALSNETKSMIYGYVNNTLWLRRPVHSILKEMEKVLIAPQADDLNGTDANVEVRYTEMMAINEWFETVKSLKFNRTKPSSKDIQTTNA